jgi:hypothetical protein
VVDHDPRDVLIETLQSGNRLQRILDLVALRPRRLDIDFRAVSIIVIGVGQLQGGESVRFDQLEGCSRLYPGDENATRALFAQRVSERETTGDMAVTDTDRCVCAEYDHRRDSGIRHRSGQRVHR